MHAFSQWFPQWETRDIDLSCGVEPSDAIRQPNLAGLQRFGFVSVWELTGHNGDDPSAIAGDIRPRMA
jgi:hypothetical protein